MNNNIIYVNVLESYSCDSDDIGILVSDNIVAVEMASINFIKASTKRRKLNRNLIGYLYNNGGMHQLETLQEVFNTSSLYELYNADIDAVVVRESSKWKDVGLFGLLVLDGLYSFRVLSTSFPDSFRN